jgi:hypothetical protein
VGTNELSGSSGLALVLAAAISALAVARGGLIEYDGAVYLERGLYHAEQVEARGEPVLARLPWSLRYESPKPPLLHGLVATLALAFGRERIPAILFGSIFLPLAALLVATAAAARTDSPRSSWLAVAALAAAPLILRVNLRLLAETTLAACVTLAGLAALRMSRERPTGPTAVWLGLALGAAALAKLTGVICAAALLAGTAVLLARRAGPRAAARLVVLAAAVAVLVAGGWYFANGVEALDFGRTSATSWAHEDRGHVWSRAPRLLGASLGAPLAAACFVAAIARARRPAREAPARELMLLAGFVAVPLGIVVVAASNFDPRFWTAPLGLVAAWIGVELASWSRRSRARATLAATLVAITAGIGASRLAAEPRSGAPWELPALLERRAPLERICNLGQGYDWNRYQLRLMAQVSRLRPRARVVDLLRETEPSRLAEVVPGCDLLFVYEPAGGLGDRTQVRENDGFMSLRPVVEELARASLVEDRGAAAALGADRPLRVWRRPAGEDAR